MRVPERLSSAIVLAVLAAYGIWAFIVPWFGGVPSAPAGGDYLNHVALVAASLDTMRETGAIALSTDKIVPGVEYAYFLLAHFIGYLALFNALGALRWPRRPAILARLASSLSGSHQEATDRPPCATVPAHPEPSAAGASYRKLSGVRWSPRPRAASPCEASPIPQPSIGQIGQK